MIPVLVLVGRPNVGKSTLFNQLTKTRNALVADFPGLTRDRQYGQAEFEGKPYIIVDTGGVGVDDMAVDSLMSKQSAKALEEADIVLFVVDGRAGLTGIDQSIASSLRKVSKPVCLVVNKTEGLEDVDSCSEFLSLGFKQIIPVSAAHGRGLHALQESVLSEYSAPTESELGFDESQPIKIAFAGRPNVGKSTAINRILGEERVVVYDMPGTTRDSIYIPFERADKHYILIDTAGVRRRARVDDVIEKFSVLKTLQSIKESHVCVMLLDAVEGLTEQDMHLLGFIIESGKALVIAVNKWDGLSEEHREEVKQTLVRRLHFANFAKVKFISALHGSGVGLLFKDIDEAYASATQRFSTPALTRLLQDLVMQHAPPLVNSRRIKLRYAHTGGHNPPRIIIHGNQLQSLPESYKRYLTNAFINHLGLVGTPLKIEYKTTDNPYKGKKNKLTDRQIERRKRLMKRVKRR
jgi:GTP-binding protein